MIWHKLIKKVDAPDVIPAPFLMFAAVALCGFVIWQEITLTNQHRPPVQIIIDQERDDVEDIDQLVSTPQNVKTAFDSYMAANTNEKLDAAAIKASQYFTELTPSDQIIFLAYAGKEMTSQLKFNEAVDIFKTLSQSQIIQSESAFAFGLSLSRIGRDEEALTAYAAHYSAFPEHQANTINYGLMLNQFKYYEQANDVLAYAASITSGERRGKALSAQGDALMSLGRPEEAVAVLKRSIEYRPSNSSAWRKLANASRRAPSATPMDVIAAYTKSSALAPQKDTPLYDLANYLFTMGRFREAIPIYSRAHALAKDRFIIMFKRALNLQISGRLSSSRRVLKKLEKQGISRAQKRQTTLLKAIIGGSRKEIKSLSDKLIKTQNEDKSINQYLLVLAALEGNQFSQVEAMINSASEDSDYKLLMQYAYGRSLYQHEKYNEAAGLFNSISKESPNSSMFRYDNSRALIKIGKLKEALKESSQAYLLEPSSKRISLEYSHQLLDQNQAENAIIILDNLLEAYPHYSRAMIQLAQIYTSFGDNISAIQLLSQAYELDNTDSEVALMLIETQISLSLYEDALIKTDEILSIDSGLIDARMFRVNILQKLGEMKEYYVEIDRILALAPDYQPALSLKYEEKIK